MGYQSAALASQSCGAQRNLLARREGQATRGHEAGEIGIAQRAEMGYCSRRATFSHIAAPPSYELGPCGDLYARGMQPWANFGPLGGRRSAARSAVPSVLSPCVVVGSVGRNPDGQAAQGSPSLQGASKGSPSKSYS